MKKVLKDVFEYPPIKSLKLTSEEKNKWKPIILQIYEQDLTCKNLPNSSCVDDSFTHLYLARDDKTKQIVVRGRCCFKKKLQTNYLICGFAKNKLNLSLVNDKNTCQIEDANEVKLNNLLKASIKNNNDIGIYFYGRSGIGKTHKIISYCNDMILNHNKTVSYVFLPQLVRELKENFDLASWINKKIIDDCCNADILVLDDFGAEYTSAWFYLNVLLIILNNRCENNKKVIIISNFDPSKVAKFLQKSINLNTSYAKDDIENKMIIIERLFDRLVQLTNNKKISYTCKSRRQMNIN